MRKLIIFWENQPQINRCNKQNFNTKEKHSCNSSLKYNHL